MRRLQARGVFDPGADEPFAAAPPVIPWGVRFQPDLERADLLRWIESYERAWRTPGTALLEGLFAADAKYLPSPFDPPLRGRAAISAFWEAEREGANEVFTLAAEPVAVEGDVGVARAEVLYGGPPERVYRDLWIVALDGHGRCTSFEEWPFFPGQRRAVG
jgi:ketosteroid isomerase-like protein